MSRTGPNREVRRGEIWLIEVRGSGSELRGRRPAVVLQNDVGNRFAATTIVALISRRSKPLPIHVPLAAGIAGLHSDEVGRGDAAVVSGRRPVAIEYPAGQRHSILCHQIRARVRADESYEAPIDGDWFKRAQAATTRRPTART